VEAIAMTILAVALSAAVSAAPMPPDLEAARQWMRANWVRAAPLRGEPAAAASPGPGLVVLANHGPVLLNGRPDGRRLKIAEVEYSGGLLCHAVSRVLVRLPGPGATFTAWVGIDTHAGGGSVEFSVQAAGQEAFRSDVRHCGQPGVPVTVALNGATEFLLSAGDAGDGIACDHAAWAEAKAVLEDGREVRLADLPVRPPGPNPRLRATPPFSFVYGGQPSDALLPGWRFRETRERLDAQRTRCTQAYTDPLTGLALRCEAVEYDDFPVVEWTLHLRNEGEHDTPVLEGLQALDAWMGTGMDRYLLHHAVGSPCQANDFEPLATPLGPGLPKRITAAGGRPTNSDLCYFNLEWNRGGAVVGVGWPGQWAATWERDGERGVRACVGQERLRVRLHPGEEIRSPQVALLFWQGGDWVRAQNLWRRWLVAHVLPRPGGTLIAPHYAGCFGNLRPNAAEEIEQIAGWRRAGISLDYWFIDAGWYTHPGDWPQTGTWEVDTERFPHGLREVADACHAQGTRFIVWFEPERAAAGSWLTANHPEWVLGGAQGGVVNLGHPKAWRWLVDRIDSLLTSEGIDVYRQDHNIDPLSYWQGHDAPDREGMTEMGHATGYLALWDELLRRHPGLWIDSCASGGRRNDLETLRRSVPLLRSDYPLTAFNASGAPGQQCQTYGLALWMPYHGTGAPFGDPYTMRSSYAPAFRMGWDVRNQDIDLELLRRTVAEFRLIAADLLGDFYPLTPYSLANDAWLAWQFDRPEAGRGSIQAFRRAECPQESLVVTLRGLEPDTTYTVTDLDRQTPVELKGSALASGFTIEALEKPAARVLVYERHR